MANSEATDVFPPGFRFHPSEQQLLSYYLLNKKSNPAIAGDYNLIRELHELQDREPSYLHNLPWYSYGYKGRKRHWYFYTVGVSVEEEKKAKQGCWKRTGKVRDVFNCHGVVLGTKTSYVYYKGSSDGASRTNCILYQYALANHVEGSFVIWRLFSRSDNSFIHSCAGNDAGVNTPKPEPEIKHVSITSNEQNFAPGVYHLPPGSYIPELLTPNPLYCYALPTPQVDSKPSSSEPTDLSQLTTVLVNATPETRRNFLGENLFIKIERWAEGKADKVTGMLLELDNHEVLHLLESPEALKAKVAEALEILA